MAIHHTLIKRAEKNGIQLSDLGTEEDAKDRYKAFLPEFNRVVFGPDPKYTLDDAMSIREILKSYLSFKVDVQDDNTVIITVRGAGIEVKGLRAAAAFGVAKKAWLESRENLDIDDEEADAELEGEIEDEAEKEDGRGGSVVSEKYRARYAEEGHPNNCGDWLASLMETTCSNKEGFNLELFGAICEANGVDMSKYKIEKASDRGRYRMSGGNMLRRVVWHGQELKMPDTINGGESYRPPGEWIEYARDKYKFKARVAPVATTPVKKAEL